MGEDPSAYCSKLRLAGGRGLSNTAWIELLAFPGLCLSPSSEEGSLGSVNPPGLQKEHLLGEKGSSDQGCQSSRRLQPQWCLALGTQLSRRWEETTPSVPLVQLSPTPGQIRRLEREVDTAHPELPLSQRGGNWDFPQPLCTQNVNSTSVIHTQFNRWAHRMYSEITVY